MHESRDEKEKKPLVLDTSAIYNGTDYPADTVLYATPQIVSEVRRVYRSDRAEFFIDTRLTVMMPSSDSMKAVRGKAEENGDIARLSEPDLEILSLAYELGAILVTEDYSIQNTASALGVEYRSLYIPRISSYVQWEIVCKACGLISLTRGEKECRICGGKLITRRKKTRPV